MTADYPTARSIQRALGVLERLPHEALVDLAERLIDRLDTAKPDCDLELDEDACDAGECSGLVMRGDGHPGDADDAEPEEDNDDDAEEEEPLAPGKRGPSGTASFGFGGDGRCKSRSCRRCRHETVPA